MSDKAYLCLFWLILSAEGVSDRTEAVSAAPADVIPHPANTLNPPGTIKGEQKNKKLFTV